MGAAERLPTTDTLLSGALLRNSTRPRSPSHGSSRSFCTACGSTEPSSTGRRKRLPRSTKEITRFPRHGGKSRPCRDGGDGEIVRFFASVRKGDALATLIHQRRLTPSCGGHAPTAERTVGPARMIVESLTPRPGIREHNRPKPAVSGCSNGALIQSPRRRERKVWARFQARASLRS
jgi:hypothetical protein